MNLRPSLALVLLSLACAPADDGTNTIDPEWPADEPLSGSFDLPPYLNMPSPGVIEVSWGTPEENLGIVRYGNSADRKYDREVFTDTYRRIQHVLLTDLKPGTAYFYEVQIDGTDAVRQGVFVTPGRETLRFVHFGEFHAPSEAPRAAFYTEQIRAFRPHVIVDSGDMVDDGENMEEWRSYLQTSAPWISNVILLPGLSNHVNGDTAVALFAELFCLPHNERWYTARFGPIEFFAIDSTFDEMGDIETDEVGWLGAENAARHDGEDDPFWVFGSWHYPACSSSYRDRSEERSWVHTNLVETFRQTGGIDAILVGHDKYYERSRLHDQIFHLMTNVGMVEPDDPGQNADGCVPEVTNTTSQSVGFFTLAEDRTITGYVTDPTGAEIDAFVLAK
jgi:hypothetical protein